MGYHDDLDAPQCRRCGTPDMYLSDGFCKPCEASRAAQARQDAEDEELERYLEEMDMDDLLFCPPDITWQEYFSAEQKREMRSLASLKGVRRHDEPF